MDLNAINDKLEQHEQKRLDAVNQAVKQTIAELGDIPAPFAFFLMGSAGRKEQLHATDQDHGLICHCSDDQLPYFRKLGQQIVIRMEQAGYERCSGGVMASEVRWCKTNKQWEAQLSDWLNQDTFEHIRHLLTFFDGRVIYGEAAYLDELKKAIFMAIDENPRLLSRFAENTGRVPLAMNIFGKLLVKKHGSNQGTLHIKEQILFPYVNGMRLLALAEKRLESSTLERMKACSNHLDTTMINSFSALLEARLNWQTEYQAFAHLNPKFLSKEEQKQVKQWVIEGRRLYDHVEKVVDEHV